MHTALLVPYIDRITPADAADRMHPAVWLIGERADSWARSHGLIIGEPDSTALGRGRFERLAARLLPETDEVAVTLFAKWLIWVFALDDSLDEGPLGNSATSVHALYSDLLKAVRRGHARPDARPLEVALLELWDETAVQMSPQWRRRFLAGFEEHRAACAEEAVNRRTGRLPTVEGYPVLRRKAVGPFLLDLVEPLLGCTPPRAVAATPAWHVLTQGVMDLIAWSNDVASYRKESERGDVHNFLTVVGAAFDLAPTRAIGWVNDEISLRTAQILAAMQTLPGEIERLELDTVTTSEVMELARHLLAAPRAHLDWLLESGRYRDAEPGPGAAPTGFESPSSRSSRSPSTDRPERAARPEGTTKPAY